jgi:hypothetical protein
VPCTVNPYSYGAVVRVTRFDRIKNRNVYTITVRLVAFYIDWSILFLDRVLMILSLEDIGRSK